MSPGRPISVLVAALGGQGGRVLADWMVEAAARAGYPAQATSIAGVAQRTGATTYYFELFPEREPQSPPVFSLFPDAAEVDLVAALEPTEAARAMSRGLITPDTVVISSLERLYTTAEKLERGDGRVDLGHLVQTLERGCKRLIALWAPHGSEGQLNAMMFGAIARCGLLPLREEDCRQAIVSCGVAVESNLKGFDAGLDLSPRAAFSACPDPARSSAPAPLGYYREVSKIPEPLREVIAHSLARITDYQGREYASLFLARMGKVIEADARAGGSAFGWRLSRIVAQRLAAWMCYEDVIRVAQAKTRPGRLARIRAEAGASAEEPLEVIDYLKPAREEFMSLLPAGIEWLVPRFLARGVAMRVKSSSPWGFALLRMLSAMRRVRPRTSRFAEEQNAIEAWLAAILGVTGKHYELAINVAELAAWARGYGKVRNRGLSALSDILEQWESRLENDRDRLGAEVERSLYRARHDPQAACTPAALTPRLSQAVNNHGDGEEKTFRS